MNKQSLFPEQVFDVPAVSVRFILLGGFYIQCGEQSLTEDQIHLRKARDLLKLLALAPNHRLHREEVLDLLWPEQSPQQAAHNLSQTLYTLRPKLTTLDACIHLEFDEECLFLLPVDGVSTDVEDFEKAARSALSRAGQINNQTLTCCQDAIQLYTGDLLPDDGPSDLFYQRREQFRQLYVDLLLSFAHANLELNAFVPAIQALQQVIEIDPAHEEAHFQLMRAFALNDQRQMSLRQFQLLTDALRSELGVEPSPESLQLRNQIQKGESIIAHRRMARKIGKCPYRGLFAFQEVDAPFYFGRTAFVNALEEAIQARKLVVAIVGSSGSGKSSALYAGLFPRLRKTGGFQFVSFRPGNQPFYALADALIPIIEPGLSKTDCIAETRKLEECLRKREVSLLQIIHNHTDQTANPQQLLLVIDQFEELYTLCPDVDQQKAFVDELLACVDRKTTGLVILIALRADFMGQALAHRPFADTLQEASLLMGPMTREELHLAIEKPAELQGAVFEPGLVERILDDVGEKPGNLPLLEFTLTQLWERQTDGWLTHRDYEAMGYVEGALAAYADQVYADLEEEQRDRARLALVQLVQPGEGTEDTRRIATCEELGVENWQLIQHLANKRLVVTGRDAQGRETAEVVHEALIRKWGQFQEWMENDRAFRAWQEQLRAHLRGWQESGQDEGALLHGVPLGVAQTWLGERGDQVSQAERDYIDASLALQERLQRERQRRRQQTVMALVGGLIIAVILTVFALIQRQTAEQERKNAEQERQVALQQASVLLSGQAETELANGFHDRAVLLALAALEEFPYTVQAEHALGQAVSYNRALGHYLNHQSAVTSVAWSPDGSMVASSSSSENRVDIWEPATGKTILSINMPKGISGNKLDMALHVQWTLDGKHLLTLTGDRYSLGSQDYDLHVWNATSGDLISSLEIANQADPVSGELGVTFVNYPTGAAAEIAPISGRLASLGGDNTAIVWDRTWKKPEVILSGHSQSLNSVDWSPDETEMVTASMDGSAIIWDVKNGDMLFSLKGHEGRVNLALWSPDGTYLATGGEDGTLRLWNPKNGELLRRIDTNAGEVSSLVWAPNALRILSGHKDGSIQIWDTASGKLLETLQGHQGIITDLKWSPLDDNLISADGSSNVRIWNAAPSTAWRLYPPQADKGGAWTVQGSTWSSDSQYLVLAGGDVVNFTHPASFAIWDVRENKLIMEILGDSLNLMGLEAHFSPDDQTILYLGFSGFPDFSGLATAYAFDAWKGEIIRTFTPGNDILIRGVEWSPDGSQVATGLFNGDIMIWDYKTGKRITKLTQTDEGYMNTDIEWSPDGEKIATTCDDGIVWVWNTDSWEPLYKLQHEPPTYPWTANWSNDGTRLLTTTGNDEQGAKDHTARIWNGETGDEILVFNGHSKAVTYGDWSPNDRRIATFSNDGTVRVWDTATGHEYLLLKIPVGYGGYAWWSPDGKYLAIVGNATLVSIWRVWQTTEELIDFAKECCVFRELTDAERMQFGLD
jgi:WD40 repeat protein/DNA-binding SARP family transcriptional activator